MYEELQVGTKVIINSEFLKWFRGGDSPHHLPPLARLGEEGEIVKRDTNTVSILADGIFTTGIPFSVAEEMRVKR